jgi:hypothetical protein
MGTWGYSITEDDTALDTYDEYLDYFNANKSPKQIEAELRKSFADALADEDDAVSVELGMAKAQWDCGHVTPAVVKRIKKLIDSDAGMALWEEAGPKAAAKRLKVLDAFLEKLQSPNPKPKKPRKPTSRQPIFQPGDCLALKNHETGKYAAAIVLLNPIEEPRPGQDTEGVNSLGFLDYYSAKLPSMKVFESREWLYVKLPYPDAPDEWVIAVAHPAALLWNVMHSKKVVEKFGHSKPDVTVVGQVKLQRDEGLDETFTVHWEITDNFERVFKAYAAVKKNPKAKLRRSVAEMFKHHKKLKKDLEKAGFHFPEMKFDLSPLNKA